MLSIDGSEGEGGGQIVRTAASLAAVTGTPFEIQNVRGKRTKPGLQPQHLAAVRAAATLCDARLSGDAVGSMFLSFEPTRRVEPGSYRFDIGTAGASTLVAQTVLMPLALASGASEVVVIGGTYNPHAPAYEFFEGVFLRAAQRLGLRAESTLERAGYFPRGGGEVRLQIDPMEPEPLDLTDRGDLESLVAVVVTSGLPDEVAERGAMALLQDLPEARLVVRRPDAFGVGAAIVLSARFAHGVAGFTSLGERGKRMESLASEVSAEFRRFRQGAACVDQHLADQLVLPAALSGHVCRWTTPVATEHLRTVMCLVERFLPVRCEIREGAVFEASVQPA